MRNRVFLRTPTFNDIISLGLVLNVFLMRPAALGQSLSWIAMVVSVVLVGAYLILNRGKQRFTHPQLRMEMLGLCILVAAYWVYIGPISALFGRSNLEYTIRELVTTVAIVIPYAIFLVDAKANRTFFRQLCTLISLLGISSLVTVALSFWLGSRDPLFLFTLNVKGYTDNSLDSTAAVGAVYFPLSMLYTDFVSGAVSLDRYCAFFREAGIYQAVACFFFVYEAFTRRSWFVILGLLSGIILAFSSLGIVLLATTIGLIYLFDSQRLHAGRAVVAVIFISLAYPLAMYTPFIGLEDKLDTHSTSVSDRSEAIDRGIDAVSRNPVGYGLFSSTGENDGICLISSLGAIGIFGFLCQFLILSGWRPGSRERWRKVVACSPLLITALVSEPIAGEPMIYIVLMAYIPRLYRELATLQRRPTNFHLPPAA
jgi:hypothetical protein